MSSSVSEQVSRKTKNSRNGARVDAILEAAGRSTASLALDGTSLLPVLLNGDEVPAETLFWRFNIQTNPIKAVRRDNWKYVIDRGTQLLFDLDADIGERSDQFSRRPDIASQLRDALTDWEQSLAVEE